MRSIRIKQPGSYDVLELVERPAPVPGPDDLLVRVRAVGVNRADCMQRLGTCPIPPGANWGDIPGLELAGEIVGVGPSVHEYKVGDRVFGLVQHSGYAEYAVVDSGLALSIPSNLDFVQAASIIEAYATANETVFELGGLKVGETILIQAAASSVGSTALQRRWIPLLKSGRLKPIVHATFPLEKAAAAQELMESNANFGKIVLTVD